MERRTPLNEAEDVLWRALSEVVITLPRALDEEFLRDTGVTTTEYGVLAALSESPGRECRISALATTTALSLSRISRVVDGMAKRGLVSRRKCPDDGRSSFAVLTDRGLGTLEAAYPGHLDRVRRHVFDQLGPEEVTAMGPLIARVARALRGGGGEPPR